MSFATYSILYSGMLFIVLAGSAVWFCTHMDDLPADSGGDVAIGFMLLAILIGWVWFDLLGSVFAVDVGQVAWIRRAFKIVTAVIFFLAAVAFWKQIQIAFWCSTALVVLVAIVSYVVSGRPNLDKIVVEGVLKALKP